MKRIFALFLALTMALSLTAFAGEFNAGVTFDTDADGNTTVEVADSDLFDTQTVTLTVACPLETAYVVFEGKAVTSTLADGKITFAIIDGGIYTIKAGEPTAEELPEEPEEPESPDTPDQPDTPANPDTPNTPTTPVDPVNPNLPQHPVGPNDKEEQPKQPPFTDLKENDWFYADVAWVYEKGLMNGMSDNAFGPNATTSRGMIVTILWRLEGMPAAGACTFADVKAGSYYEQAIAWAAENGIVNGVSSTAFAPDNAITREQFAAILYRYAKDYKGYDVSVGESTNILSYEDAFDVSEYAIPALQWACGAGVMNGSDGYLLPAGSATRAQAAALLHRFCENVK